MNTDIQKLSKDMTERAEKLYLTLDVLSRAANKDCIENNSDTAAINTKLLSFIANDMAALYFDLDHLNYMINNIDKEV